MDIENKRVVVTGASSGIGLRLVRLLLEKGCTVVAASRNIEKIGISDKNLLLKKCDVSLPEDIDNLFDYAISQMSGIDIFIANAGFTYYEKIAEQDWNHIKTIFDTNIISLIYCAEKMKQLHGEQPYNFVCTASGMSFLSLPGYSLYSGTKAAIRGFADAYRYELCRGQHIQAVFPIATNTNFFKHAGDGPVPWPVQKPEAVAVAVIKGIRRNKKNIYPSMLFRIIMTLDRIFPFITSIYAGVENKKYQYWLKSKSGPM